MSSLPSDLGELRFGVSITRALGSYSRLRLIFLDPSYFKNDERHSVGNRESSENRSHKSSIFWRDEACFTLLGVSLIAKAVLSPRE